MFVDSKYAKMFVSNGLTRQKYDELYDFAVSLRDFRNQISKEVSGNLEKYLEYNKYQFITEMRGRHSEVGSSFDNQLYSQVLDCYRNKFNAIKHGLKFEKVSYVCCEAYKRDTGKHRKGDFKKVRSKRESSPLSICLTYLARYGRENTIQYIEEHYDSAKPEQQKLYRYVLDSCRKFGFVRLFNLALSKRHRIINRHTGRPVEFKSLSFSGRSRKSVIVDYNRNYGSVINSFVSLSGFGRKSFDIPVKFALDYHGNIHDYLKKSNDYEYTVTFNERRHQVTVCISKDGQRYIPEAGGDVIGIDVNCKHNLFSLSNETSYDYDRKLLNDYCRLAVGIDRLKEDKTYNVGRRMQRKLDVMKMKMVKSEQQIISGMCRELLNFGCRHIVMEDLDNGFGRSHAKDAGNADINYNRKVKFLGLSSLKHEVEHIARKYDIAVSIVHPEYTSKMCPVCGCIEDENRPDQETFDCIECGHNDNADFNAAKNIRNRVTEAVLCEKLLKKLDNGAYEPKSMKRDKVKEVLLSYRTSSKSRDFTKFS